MTVRCASMSCAAVSRKRGLRLARRARGEARYKSPSQRVRLFSGAPLFNPRSDGSDADNKRKQKSARKRAPSIKQVLPDEKQKGVRAILFVLLFHTVGWKHSLPPGGRWHAKRDGRSPRDFGFVLIISQRALPHPTSSGAPSRREPLVCAHRKSVVFS